MTREEAIEKMQKQKARYLEEWLDYSGVSKAYDMAIEALQAEPVKHGEWEEKKIYLEGDCEITEWQSARCSKCGKYHTTPYMYLFNDFNFCPNCGAKMKGGADK